MVEDGLGVANERQYTQGDEPRAAQMTRMTSEQIRAARGLLRWEQHDLAAASGLAVVTIKGIEKRPGQISARADTLYAIEDALVKAGVEFIDADNGGSGVRFKRRQP